MPVSHLCVGERALDGLLILRFLIRTILSMASKPISVFIFTTQARLVFLQVMIVRMDWEEKNLKGHGGFQYWTTQRKTVEPWSNPSNICPLCTVRSVGGHTKGYVIWSRCAVDTSICVIWHCMTFTKDRIAPWCSSQNKSLLFREAWLSFLHCGWDQGLRKQKPGAGLWVSFAEHNLCFQQTQEEPSRSL